MPNMQKMTTGDKRVIVALRDENLSLREISARVGFGKTAVANFLKKFASTGSIQRKKGSGTIRKTSGAEDRILRRMSIRDRFKTAEELRREFVTEVGPEISTSTVKRRLAEAGIGGHRPAKKPFLTQRMRSKRLQWAKDHQMWTIDDWKKVIFSDESKFNLNGSDGMLYVRRKRGERYSDQCILQRARHSASRMVWGCFFYHGMGQLALLNGTVKAADYKIILEENLIPSIEEHSEHNDRVIFQDDSAPCHRAKMITKYLSDLGLSTLDWPGNSPDLNPIENLWHMIKVQVRRKKPQTLRELDLVISEVWHNGILPEYREELVSSMPRRIKAVIQAKGGPTKY